MPLSRKQTKRSKRSKKQQRRRRSYKGGATATLEDALRRAQVVLSSRQTNADFNPYDPSRKQLLESAKREVQRIQWELDQARGRIFGVPPAPAPALAPAPAYQQPMALPIRPPPLPMPQPMPAPTLLYQQQQQQQPKNNNRLAANQKAAANAAINSLKLLGDRAQEDVYRLTYDVEKKRVARNQNPTDEVNRLFLSDAQRKLEEAKVKLQRIKTAQLNPTGSNALLLLATTMKSQNNVRGRLTAAALNKKVPKKNLMAYTMKDLLTYLGS